MNAGLFVVAQAFNRPVFSFNSWNLCCKDLLKFPKVDLPSIYYVMSSVVPGLVKIGKTGTTNFASRMYQLEHNGYSNVTGLKREFAIEVEDYEAKEKLLDDIFSKSRIGTTELFAIDLNLIIQLLSSFDGKKIYPEQSTKEEVFDRAEENREKAEQQKLEKQTECEIPDGLYYLSYKRKGENRIKATLEVKCGKFYLRKGNLCHPPLSEKYEVKRIGINIQNGILQEDIQVSSLSTAASIITGTSINGWDAWKDENGKSLSEYRNEGKSKT